MDGELMEQYENNPIQQKEIQEAGKIYLDTLSSQGTQNYLALITSIVQELGMTLAFSIEPKETAQIRSTQNWLTSENYDTFVSAHLAKLGIDTQKLEMDIHTAVGAFFCANREKPNHLLLAPFTKEAN